MRRTVLPRRRRIPFPAGRSPAARAGRRRVTVRGGRGPLVPAVVLLAMFPLLGACSAPVRPDPPSAPPSSAPVEVPDDGISLRGLGFENGPATAFTLPRTLVIRTAVDQPNGVTVVLSKPAAADVAAYLIRTLPETGFVVTDADPSTASLTFTGYGWQGSFTGTGSSSAVILRPAS